MAKKYKTLEEELAGMNFLEKRMWLHKRLHHKTQKAPGTPDMPDNYPSKETEVLCQQEDLLFEILEHRLTIVAANITGDPDFVEKWRNGFIIKFL